MNNIKYIGLDAHSSTCSLTTVSLPNRFLFPEYIEGVSLRDVQSTQVKREVSPPKAEERPLFWKLVIVGADCAA